MKAKVQFEANSVFVMLSLCNKGLATLVQLGSFDLNLHPSTPTAARRHVKAGSTSWGPWRWHLALGKLLAPGPCRNGTLSCRNDSCSTALAECLRPLQPHLASGLGVLGPASSQRDQQERAGGRRVLAQSLKTWALVPACHLPSAWLSLCLLLHP